MTAATSPSSTVTRFVAIGDSFSAGIGAPGEVPWPVGVAGHLEAMSGEAPELHNLAVAGAMSDEIASDQLPRALELEPDLVSVICGANDVLLSVRPDTGGFGGVFDHILGSLAELNPVPLIVTATYPQPGRFLGMRERTRRRVTDGLDSVNDTIRVLSQRHGAVCLEWAVDGDEAGRDHYAPDGLHPSPLGHREAAASFAEALRPHLYARGTEHPDAR